MYQRFAAGGFLTRRGVQSAEMKENPYKSPGQYGTTFGRRPKPLVGFLLILLAIPTSLFGAYGVGMGVYKTFFEHGLWVANGLVALSVGAACLVVTFVLFRMATYFKSPGQAADVGEEHETVNLPMNLRLDRHRWQQAAQWLLVPLMFVSYWYFAPTLRRMAEAVPLPVAVAFLAGYVCLAFATDVFQIVDPSLLWGKLRDWTGWRPSHDATVFVESEVRRNWFRALGRLYLLSFILGATTLGIVMHAFGAMRPMLLVWLGQGKMTLVFGIASFGSFLVPMCLLLTWFATHPRYRCPYCGEYLSDFASLKQLNRDACCVHCGQGVPIAPYTVTAQRMDLITVGAGMCSLIVFVCALT